MSEGYMLWLRGSGARVSVGDGSEVELKHFCIRGDPQIEGTGGRDWKRGKGTTARRCCPLQRVKGKSVVRQARVVGPRLSLFNRYSQASASVPNSYFPVFCSTLAVIYKPPAGRLAKRVPLR